MMVMWSALYAASACANCVSSAGAGGRYSVSLFFWPAVQSPLTVGVHSDDLSCTFRSSLNGK